ncbi:hypothetical protein [Pedobacter borealis]|uniref:hypothetical protein n=1 Tax=Pedobacter borealis TaxID=475254 RepID=UPI0012FA080E|nr:hypothetical protein [Pedobacter borealis]
MEKTINNLVKRLNLLEKKNQSGFFSIKGGASLSEDLGNNAACTNSGTSCAGTNTGDCTNSTGTDCSKATNKAARSACSNLSCTP